MTCIMSNVLAGMLTSFFLHAGEGELCPPVPPSARSHHEASQNSDNPRPEDQGGEKYTQEDLHERMPKN